MNKMTKLRSNSESCEKTVFNGDLFKDFFTDEAIINQSSAMIETDGKITNGLSLIIECPDDADAVEIVLTYEEMKAVIANLEEERTTMPHLYSLDGALH